MILVTSICEIYGGFDAVKITDSLDILLDARFWFAS